MSHSSDPAPSSFIPRPSADPLSPFFFTGFFRLLYWTFFKPSSYYDYVHSMLGEYANKTGWRNFLAALRHTKIMLFLFECLFLIMAVGVITNIVTGFLSPEGHYFIPAPAEDSRRIDGVGSALLLFVLFAMMTAMLFYTVDIALFEYMSRGILFSMVMGMIGNLLTVVAGYAFFGMVGGILAGMLIMFGSVAAIAPGTMIVGVAVGLLSSVRGYNVSGVSGVIIGLLFGAVWSAGLLRLPFYLFQFLISLRLSSHDIVTALRHSPAMWDELMVLPQPRLDAILQTALDTNLIDGLRACGRIVSNPFQRWAVQHALHNWLSIHPDEVHRAFEMIFLQPEPYRTPVGYADQPTREKQIAFTTDLIVGELAGRSPVPGISDRLVRTLTSRLREHTPSPLTPLATAYFEMFRGTFSGRQHLVAFESYRPYQHGEETYQIFRTLYDFVSRTSLMDVSKAYAETIWLEQVNSPLRPATLEAISKLAQISHFVYDYMSLTTDVGKRDALANAGINAYILPNLTWRIKSPERFLIHFIAERWFKIITEEQIKLAAPREVRHIRNMYLVGRPVLPDSGHPFVGRRDQFEMIERLWADASLKSPIILHGQRRMGKSSILYHLEKNLGPAYIMMYGNLQSLAAVDSTSAFVYNLCDEIERRLRKAGAAHGDARPRMDDFAAEPFTGLRRFLNEVEDRLGNDRWLVLMLDEFEMIEDKIKEGKIRNDLLYQFRDAMLNRPRLAVVLAGLHTLDEMTRDYWSPFFSGARNVKVSYLDPDAAETLITNPWDGFELEYDREAVKLIAKVTGSQPTLLQSVCSALIDRANARLAKEGPQFSPRVTLSDVEAVLGDVLESSTYFDAVWKELAENERLVLAALAEAQPEWDVPASRAGVDSHLRGSLPQDDIDRAWELLDKRDMIDLDGGQARFRVELVRRWGRAQKPLANVLKVKQAP